MDILSLFTAQPDGNYTASIKGFKGTVRVVSPDSSYYWVNIYLQKPSSPRAFLKTVFGTICKSELDIPVTTTIIFETARMPAEATVEPEATNYVESVVNTLVSDNPDSPDVPSMASLQQQIDEQKRINTEQQAELERNAAHDQAQQTQIDANTSTNEAQERGIGEEATNELIAQVFGK